MHSRLQEIALASVIAKPELNGPTSVRPMAAQSSAPECRGARRILLDPFAQGKSDSLQKLVDSPAPYLMIR